MLLIRIDELTAPSHADPRENQEGAEDVENPAETVDQGCAACDEQTTKGQCPKHSIEQDTALTTRTARAVKDGKDKMLSMSATSWSDRRRSIPPRSPSFQHTQHHPEDHAHADDQAPPTMTALARREDPRAPRCTASPRTGEEGRMHRTRSQTIRVSARGDPLDGMRGIAYPLIPPRFTPEVGSRRSIEETPTESRRCVVALSSLERQTETIGV